MVTAKVYFPCPLCGREDTASFRLRVPPGEWGERWWIGCWKCEATYGSKEYLQELAAELGCRAIDLLQHAENYLKDLSPDSGRGAKPSKPLPSEDKLAQYALDLQRSKAPLRYLNERGITRAVLGEYEVGLNLGGRLTFPMRSVSGQLVAYKTRRPTQGGQMKALAGEWLWPLYPWPRKHSKRPLIICAGELDALAALSAGLEACSVTLGANTWRAHWTAAVYYRRCLIVYDIGERRQARVIVDGLLTAGVSARAVDLRQFGLGDKGDLNDYLRGGGKPEALLRAN